MQQYVRKEMSHANFVNKLKFCIKICSKICSILDERTNYVLIGWIMWMEVY